MYRRSSSRNSSRASSRQSKDSPVQSKDSPFQSRESSLQSMPKFKDSPLQSRESSLQNIHAPQNKDSPHQTRESIFQSAPQFKDSPLQSRESSLQSMPQFRDSPLQTREPLFQGVGPLQGAVPPKDPALQSKSSSLQSKDSKDSPLMSKDQSIRESRFQHKDSLLQIRNLSGKFGDSKLELKSSEKVPLQDSQSRPKDNQLQSKDQLSLVQPLSISHGSTTVVHKVESEKKAEEILPGDLDARKNLQETVNDEERQNKIEAASQRISAEQIQENFGVNSREIENEKRDAIQKWISQNYLNQRSISGEEALPVDLNLVSRSPQIPHVTLQGTVTSENSLKVKDITRVSKTVIVCECAKFYKQKDALVAMGMHPSQLCRDQVSMETPQFLSVDSCLGDKPMAGATGGLFYSPQSSTEDNYTGFGLDKSSRKDLLEELGAFSSLHPEKREPQHESRIINHSETPVVSDSQSNEQILQELLKLSQKKDSAAKQDFRQSVNQGTFDLRSFDSKENQGTGHKELPQPRNAASGGSDLFRSQSRNSDLLRNQPINAADGGFDPLGIFNQVPQNVMDPEPPPQGFKAKNDSGFASTTETLEASPASTAAGFPAGPGYNHQNRHPQFHHQEVAPLFQGLPVGKRKAPIPIPPELIIARAREQETETSGTCSSEVAQLTSGLALLSPMVPEMPQAPPGDRNQLAEHFREDYFSFTGLVDVAYPPQEVNCEMDNPKI